MDKIKQITLNSFTMIEMIFVILIVSIVAVVVSPQFCQTGRCNSDLVKAANQVLGHIRYTRHLAMIDNKFQPYPINFTNQERTRSKFWFKQWWQIYFTNTGNNIFYHIFSDAPTNSNSTSFNGGITNGQDEELARDPHTNKYLVGNWEELSGSNNFPEESKVVKRLNLTQEYSITGLRISNTSYTSSSMPNGLGHRVRILFDNLGRPYFDEGDTTNGFNETDINPYDWNERKLLRTPVSLELQQNSDSIFICIEPETGYSRISFDGC